VRAEITQESLSQGLATVGRAVPSRTSLPVLSAILITTDSGRLRMVATNADTTITVWLSATVLDDGAAASPARLLGELVGSLPKGTVTLTVNQRDQSLNVRCMPYDANIKGYPPDEFPPAPTMDDETAISVDASQLRDAIGQVAFAAATDDTRPSLTGVLFSLRDGSLTLAAADGFRLAVKTVAVPSADAGSFEILVPARALQELARVVGDLKEDVRVGVNSTRSHVRFRATDFELVSRLIDGAFPDFRKIIPSSHTGRTLVSTRDLISTVKVASYFARDANNVVRLSASQGESDEPAQMVVAGKSPEVGDTQAQIEVTIEGEGAQIAFNAKYLADALGAIDTAKVVIETTSPARPGVFHPAGDDSYTHVIMPMHVNK
jgi:DNA polymerase III subunit beta